MLKTRLLTAAIGIPLLAVVVWVGGGLFAVVAAAAAAAGAWECGQLLQRGAWTTDRWIGVIAAGAIPLVGLAGTSALLAVTGLAIAVVLAVATFGRADVHEAARMFQADAVGISYVAVPFSLFVVIRGWSTPTATAIGPVTRGVGWIVFILAVVWATDTAAYAVGRLLGRHRFFPRISPSKTWEGTLAGLVAATAVGFFGSAVCALPVEVSALLGLVMGGAAIAGDLGESVLKRAAGVKDASHLIPGHGGVLDRVDSLIFAVVVAYAGALLTGVGG